MNLEIRKQGRKKKYYLAHSFREGKKVKKIRRYLGINLTKEQLNKLRLRAEEIIRQQIESYKLILDPLRHTLTERELSLFRGMNFRNKIEVRHLSEEDWQKFTEIFTYNTNAIEGSEISQKEVKEVLEEDKWPRDIRKEDISETYGVAEAIRYLRKTREHLSIALIKKLHDLVFRNSKPFAGKLRPKGIEVVIRDGLGNIIHAGAPANRIRGLLEDLIRWYGENRKKYPPILLAAVIHDQFENIHPFQDGNGRVGRLLLNNILMKHHFPPVNIGLRNRREYYDSLQAYQKKGDIRPTITLILKEYNLLKKELGAYKK